MSNGNKIYPEFTVQCVMCDQSFSATADHLRELVKIVGVHLEQTVLHPEHHEAYHKKHGKPDYPDPDSESQILESPLFKWGILRLVPFNEIFQLFKISPKPNLEQLLEV